MNSKHVLTIFAVWLSVLTASHLDLRFGGEATEEASNSNKVSKEEKTKIAKPDDGPIGKFQIRVASFKRTGSYCKIYFELVNATNVHITKLGPKITFKNHVGDILTVNLVLFAQVGPGARVTESTLIHNLSCHQIAVGELQSMTFNMGNEPNCYWGGKAHRGCQNYFEVMAGSRIPLTVP